MIPKPWKILARMSPLALLAFYSMPAHTQLSQAQAAQLSQNANQHVIVIMKSQHAVAPTGTSAMAERANMIAAEQAPLMDELRQVRATNLKTFRLVNAFAATVSKDYVTRLKANPAVAAVIPDSVVRLPRAAADNKASFSAQADLTAANPPHVIPGACGAHGAVLLESEGLALTYTNSDVPHAPTARSLGITGAGVKVAWLADGIDPNNINFIRPDGSHAFVDLQDFTGEGPASRQAVARHSSTPTPSRARASMFTMSRITATRPIPPSATFELRERRRAQAWLGLSCSTDPDPPALPASFRPSSMRSRQSTST
jgi:hypothetical protein